MKLANFLRLIMSSTFLLMACFGNTENRIDRQSPYAPELAGYGEKNIGVRTLNLIHSDQIDVVNIKPKDLTSKKLPHYDRPLTVELWYPATDGEKGNTNLKVYIRDGKTEVTIKGKAMRGISIADGKFPLIIISHGHPGNRFVMAHLAENLASKGYVVASIDHTDSTYRTYTAPGAFLSTLLNRPMDQFFVLEQIDRLSNDESSFLYGHVDASNTGIIGHSMGGYGAIVSAGGGMAEKYVNSNLGISSSLLAMYQANSASYKSRFDNRIKTAVVFGPWGMKVGLWNNESLQGIKIPMLFVAGSVDDISGYEKGTRAIWKGAKRIDRSLLTFDNANHNAGATMPAPEESYQFNEEIGFNMSEHYSDAVWDTVVMNNIAQHFVTAWMGKYLKLDKSMSKYMQLVENSNKGIWMVNENGVKKKEHTYWEGFPNRSAKGLRFETLKAEQ